MLQSQLLRRRITLTVLITLIVATLAAGIEAAPAKKKKKNKKKQDKAPKGSSQVMKDVERSLVAYDTQEARALLEPLSDEQDAAVVTAWGQVLQQEQDFAGAASRFEQAAEMAPGDPTPWVHLGFDHLYANKQSKADEAFRAAADRANAILDDKPNDSDALYHLGVAQQRLNRFDDSVATLERAREASGNDAMVVFQLGVTRALQQQWQPALDLLTEALDRNSRIAYGYYYRGLCADRLNRKDLLINDMDRFLSLAPNAPEAERARRILQAAGG